MVLHTHHFLHSRHGDLRSRQLRMLRVLSRWTRVKKGHQIGATMHASSRASMRAASSSADLTGGASVAAEAASGRSHELSDTARRNVALEAVRTGNYYAEPEQQCEVIEYIKEAFSELLCNQKWLRKNGTKIRAENGLTRHYTVDEILAKRHEVDGFDIFGDPDEACAAHAAEAARNAATPADCITVGTTCVVKKAIQTFVTATSWGKAGTLSKGQRVKVASEPISFEGFIMVAIEPEGAVELKYLRSAKAEYEASVDKEDADVTLGRLAKLREGLCRVLAIDASTSSGDAVPVYDLLELLEGCASLGEMGAAVYCGERLEALVKLPAEVLDRAFTGLKPMLRPNSGKSEPSLEGPWSKPPPGRSGVPNPRKALGQLVNRLAIARRDRDLAAGGKELQQEHAETSAARAVAEQTLRIFSQALMPLMAQDAKTVAANRRQFLGEAVIRVCGEHNLTVSYGLSQAIITELESIGAVKCQGRDISLDKDVACSKGRVIGPVLNSLQGDLDVLEKLAQERLERKRKRVKARAADQFAKKRRMVDD